jgi:hypothetical protein
MKHIFALIIVMLCFSCTKRDTTQLHDIKTYSLIVQTDNGPIHTTVVMSDEAYYAIIRKYPNVVPQECLAKADH